MLQIAMSEFGPLENGYQFAPAGSQCGKGYGVGTVDQRIHVLVECPALDPFHRVHLFKKYLISGCFGHAARLSRSIVSSS